MKPSGMPPVFHPPAILYIFPLLDEGAVRAFFPSGRPSPGTLRTYVRILRQSDQQRCPQPTEYLCEKGNLSSTRDRHSFRVGGYLTQMGCSFREGVRR